MAKTENFAKVEIRSTDELRAWLSKNHSQKESVWLVTWKKRVPDKYVSTAEVLDELLCFGWIDGVRRKLDANRSMQLISPRRIRHWSGTYKARAERLIAEGRMAPPGFRSIEEAKRSGQWHLMDDVAQLVKPEDLIQALGNRPGATENFESFAPSHRRNVLRWIKLAKRPETRARRIQRVADMAARNERIPGM